MVEITISLDNDLQVICKGHTGYDDIGKDIVCSSISSIIQYSLVLLERFKIKESHILEIGYLEIKINKSDRTNEADEIFRAMKIFLGEVSHEYPKNVKMLKGERHD